VGTTDSELAFCYMLETLRLAFPHGEPDLAALRAAIQKVTQQLAQHGLFNYLLSNGEYLFAHCADKLCYVLRHAPFADAHLIDQDVTVEFSELTTPDDKVAVIATLPLTDNEAWAVMEPGEFAVFQHGAPVAACDPSFPT